VYLATVTPAGRPHVVPVHCDWYGNHLYALVGRGDSKVANLRANPAVCLHWQVTEATGWDSLIAWGRAAVLSDLEDKRRLWEGVLSYDLDVFAPGGPEGSPDSCFLEIDIDRAVVLRRFGFDGRDEYRNDLAPTDEPPPAPR
jgi:nitroimidazol reductase NimA-like FMN-containing flavoprotein (pyridoxamine 5'-phosphate oxidase superfamily)